MLDQVFVLIALVVDPIYLVKIYCTLWMKENYQKNI